MTNAQFSGEKFLNLETYKKSGDGVKTPLWFIEDEGLFYMRTPTESWKVKRLRKRQQVKMVPSDARGKPNEGAVWVAGTANLIPAADAAWVQEAFIAKYGWQKRLIDIVSKIRGNNDMTVIAVELD